MHGREGREQRNRIVRVHPLVCVRLCARAHARAPKRCPWPGAALDSAAPKHPQVLPATRVHALARQCARQGRLTCEGSDALDHLLLGPLGLGRIDAMSTPTVRTDMALP